MVDVSIQSLAQELGYSVNKLIIYFQKLGVLKNINDVITQQEKIDLLNYLQKKTLILQRKVRSVLNISNNKGKNKFIKVEIRKKHTYFKNNVENKTIPVKKNKIDFHVDNYNKYFEHQDTVITNVKNNIPEHINQKKSQLTKKNIINNKIITASIISNKLEKTHNNYKKQDFKIKLEHHGSSIKDKKSFIKDKSIHRMVNYSNDYHGTTLLNIRQADDVNDHALEKNRRNKNIRHTRYKKNNKSIVFKKDRETIKSMIRPIKNIKKKNKGNVLQQKFKKPMQAIMRTISIGKKITVTDLANKMAVKSAEVIKIMMNLGSIININYIFNQEQAKLVAEEMGHKVILYRENALEDFLVNNNTKSVGQIKTRPPIVTIMGHVDHGKTSLLDCIRTTQIVSKEAGGITQHIGAYHVKTKNGFITFLDTPGHAAFTAMRARGVQVTDIVVLVVAADDGVMPQTIESIQHAQAANVALIVAINKIDKIDSNLDQLKKELMQHSVISEEWGGSNIFVSVSAKSGYGVNDLLDAILLQAEMLELKSITNITATGVVIESYLDKGKGPVATILVREGTLKKGDILLCGCEYGKIRAMKNEFLDEIRHAGPSIPVQILGLSGVPEVGELATVVYDEKKVREVVLYRKAKFREKKFVVQKRIKLENIFDSIDKDTGIELNIILKADVRGSVEAISDALIKLSNNEVKIKIIGSGVGGITETDVSLATASNAILLAFNVRADSSAKRMIDIENIDVRYYSIIYKLLDEIRTAMSGMLSPVYKQEILGLAIVRNIFKSPKFSSIAGCMVTEGIIKKNKSVRILRENIVIYEGELESLRRFKEDVNEIRNGIECGIGIKNYNDIHIGDLIEVFEMKETQRNL